jgi:hypothetical protein
MIDVKLIPQMYGGQLCVGYCIANDLNSISPEAFGSELAQSHIRRDRKRVKRQLEYCYWGVKVRENETLR